MKTELKIPIPCPKCGGRMIVRGYEAQLMVLYDRQWHNCTKCSFEQSVDDFKKRLLTI